MIFIIDSFGKKTNTLTEMIEIYGDDIKIFALRDRDLEEEIYQSGVPGYMFKLAGEKPLLYLSESSMWRKNRLAEVVKDIVVSLEKDESLITRISKFILDSRFSSSEYDFSLYDLYFNLLYLTEYLNTRISKQCNVDRSLITAILCLFEIAREKNVFFDLPDRRGDQPQGTKEIEFAINKFNAYILLLHILNASSGSFRSWNHLKQMMNEEKFFACFERLAFVEQLSVFLLGDSGIREKMNAMLKQQIHSFDHFIHCSISFRENLIWADSDSGLLMDSDAVVDLFHRGRLLFDFKFDECEHGCDFLLGLLKKLDNLEEISSLMIAINLYSQLLKTSQMLGKFKGGQAAAIVNWGDAIIARMKQIDKRQIIDIIRLLEDQQNYFLLPIWIEVANALKLDISDLEIDLGKIAEQLLTIDFKNIDFHRQSGEDCFCSNRTSSLPCNSQLFYMIMSVRALEPCLFARIFLYIGRWLNNTDDYRANVFSFLPTFRFAVDEERLVTFEKKIEVLEKQEGTICERRLFDFAVDNVARKILLIYLSAQEKDGFSSTLVSRLYDNISSLLGILLSNVSDKQVTEKPKKALNNLTEANINQLFDDLIEQSKRPITTFDSSCFPVLIEGEEVQPKYLAGSHGEQEDSSDIKYTFFPPANIPPPSWPRVRAYREALNLEKFFFYVEPNAGPDENIPKIWHVHGSMITCFISRFYCFLIPSFIIGNIIGWHWWLNSISVNEESASLSSFVSSVSSSLSESISQSFFDKIGDFLVNLVFIELCSFVAAGVIAVSCTPLFLPVDWSFLALGLSALLSGAVLRDQVDNVRSALTARFSRRRPDREIIKKQDNRLEDDDNMSAAEKGEHEEGNDHYGPVASRT